MAVTVTDDVASDLLKRIQKILQNYEAIKDRHDKLNLLKSELLSSAIRDVERLERLAQLTENGTKLPLICVYQKEDTKLCDYIEKKANEYNETEEGKENPIAFERMTDNAGRSVLLTNDESLKKLQEFRMQYAVEKGGYVSEIPVPEFAKAANFNNAIILNGITEDQFNYIQEKAWGSKNNFSYAAKNQEDGTYSVAILAKNYIGNTKRETKDDLFSALVSEKVANTEQEKLVRKYNKDLEKKLVTYSGEKPIYIASARNKGLYIKVEADKLTVMGTENPIEIPKFTPDGQIVGKDFMVDAYKYLSKIDEPTLIDPASKDVQTLMKEKQYTDIETLLDDHSNSADDRDLEFTNEKGNKEHIRPLSNRTADSINKEKFAKLYSLELGTRATKEMSKYYVEAYAKDFQTALKSEGLAPEEIELRTNEFKEMFTSKFESINGPTLSEGKRRNAVLEVVDTITDNYSPNQKMRIEDAFVDIYNDEVVYLNEKERIEILKRENENLSQSIMVKSTDGMSKELTKIVSAAEVPMDELPLKETKTAVDEITDLSQKTIYLTPDTDLAKELNYDVDHKGYIETYIDAKAEAEANEQMGIDTIKTSKYKISDKEEIEETEFERTER